MENITVMIVEDDFGTAHLFAAMIGIEGYNTIVVPGVQEAIDTMKTERPDIVLVDLMMPAISGYELCRYVRQTPEFSDLPVIIVSAKDQPEDIEEGLKAGANLYLTKPVARRELLKAISKGLSGKT